MWSFQKSKKLYKEIERFLSGRKKLKVENKKRVNMKIYVNEVRQKQLLSYKKWLTKIDSEPEIEVQNSVDFDPVPPLNPINRYEAGEGVVIPKYNPIFCECKMDNCSDECFRRHGNDQLPYSADLVKVPPGTPIYECNRNRSCSKDYPFRVVQRSW